MQCSIFNFYYCGALTALTGYEIVYICFFTGKRNNFQLAYTLDQAETLIEWPIVYCCNGLFNVNSFSMWSWLLLLTAWTLYILIELYCMNYLFAIVYHVSEIKLISQIWSSFFSVEQSW